MKSSILCGRNREGLINRLEKTGPTVGPVLLLITCGNNVELQMKTKIYFLRDETRFVKYVGKTVKSLQERLKGHLDEAKKGSHTLKSRWIRSMQAKGLSPTISLITEVNSDGNSAEIAYIAFLKKKGIKLVNGTSGGDGGGAGEGNPNYGNHILKGRKRPEHSEWMRKNNPFKGKHHKEESIRQLKTSIRKGFENGRVGPWKGKDPTATHNKETCKCASCMTKRGKSYLHEGWHQTEAVKRQLSEKCMGRVPWNKGKRG